MLSGVRTKHEWFDDIDAEDFVAYPIPFEDLPAARLLMRRPNQSADIEIMFQPRADICRQVLTYQRHQARSRTGQCHAISRVCAATAQHAHTGAAIGIDDIIDDDAADGDKIDLAHGLSSEFADHVAGTDAAGAIGPVGQATAFKVAKIGHAQGPRAGGGDELARDAVDDRGVAFGDEPRDG